MGPACSHCGDDEARAKGLCDPCRIYQVRDRRHRLPSDAVLHSRWDAREAQHIRRLSILARLAPSDRARCIVFGQDPPVPSTLLQV